MATSRTAARFRLLLLVLALLSLAATACVGDDAANDTAIADSEEAADDAADDDAADDGSPEDAEAQDDAAEEEPADDDAAADEAGDREFLPATDDARGVEVDGSIEEKPEVTLPGGTPPDDLVIVDLIEGEGDVVEFGATVTTQYVGVSWLNDGEQFDASWDRGQPATFPLDGVIPGWTNGIPGMKEGGRRLLIIPPEDAYGSNPPPGAPIQPDDTLVFVIDVLPPPEPIEPSTDTQGVDVSENAGEAPEISLPGGEPPADLTVVDIIEGDGEEVPFNATVTTHYTGVSWLNEGAEFDSSWPGGEPATFPLSGVIPGWTQGIPGMKVGGRRLLIIPPEQAYGDSARGDNIAANDTLVFVIDMVDFQG